MATVLKPAVSVTLVLKEKLEELAQFAGRSEEELVEEALAAQNQTVRLSFEPCMMVPAVTEVCLRQPAHSKVKALVSSAQALALP